MVWLMTMIQLSTELLRSPCLSCQRGSFVGTALETLSPLWMRQRTCEPLPLRINKRSLRQL